MKDKNFMSPITSSAVTHSLTHSLTHSYPNSLTYSPIRLLTHHQQAITSWCKGGDHKTSPDSKLRSRWFLLFSGGGEGDVALPILRHILVVLVLNQISNI